MDKNLSDDLKERERLLRDKVNDYDTAAKTAQRIAALQKTKDELQKEISEYLTAPRPTAGTIKRLTSALSSLSPVDAIYKANEASLKEATGVDAAGTFASTLGTSYMKSIRDNLMTAATNKDYTQGHKTYKDIITKQMGMKDSTAATVLGVAGDIGTDPLNFVGGNAMSLLFKGVKGIGGKVVEVASKSELAEKGIDGLGRMFDIWHDVAKSTTPQKLAELKNAFTEAVESGNFDKLKTMGFDTGVYKSKPVVIADKTIKPTLASRAEYDIDEARETIEYLKTELANFNPKTNLPLRNEWSAKINTAKENLSTTKNNLSVTQEAQKTNSWNLDPEKYTALIENYKNTVKDIKEEISTLSEFRKALSPAAIKKEFAEKITRAQDRITKLQDDIPVMKVLDEAFGEKGVTGLLGKTLDTTSLWYKKIMSYSPKFQTRNMMGALSQGIAERSGGSSLLNIGSDYYQAAKMFFTKGKSNPALYGDLQKSGVMSQTGMFEGITGLPAKIANFGESLNRTALAINEMRAGKTIEQAIETTQKVFYKYGDAYKTKFEKTVMSRVLPFYSFFKGQIEYWPEALGRTGAKWGAMGKIKEDTAPDATKDYPFLTPDWWKDKFSVDAIGNIGFQLEDFLSNTTGNVKNLWGQLQPLLKGTFEIVTDWKVFQGRKLSSDKSAGQYANLPMPMQKIVGFNASDNTVNPYMKWASELMAGPILDPIKNLFDPKKGIFSVFTSMRDYNLTKESMAAQHEMQTKQDKSGGFWGNLQDRFNFSFGPTSAGASTPTSSAGSPVLTNTYLKEVAEWAKRNSVTPDKFAKEYQFSGGYEQTMFYNQSQKWGRDRADALQYSGDIAEGDQKAHEQRLANLKAENEFYLRDKTDSDKALLELNLKYDKTRVRKMGEAQVFSAKELTTYTTLGLNAYQIAFNKNQEKFISAQSKLAETWKQSSDSSPQSILKTAEAERTGAKAQALSGGLGEEWLTKMFTAIQAKQDHALNELELRNRAAIANIIDNWADAEADGFTKIERKRQAAQERYYSTDDYKNAKAREDYAQIKQAQTMIDAKYDQQRREELVKQTKAHMEEVEKITKGRAENIIAALKDIYKRGGMGIKEYYGKELEQHSSQYTEKAQQALNVSEAVMASATNNNKPTVENYGIDYTVQPISEENRKKFNVGYGVTPTSMMIQKVTEQIEDVIKTSKTLEEFKKKINDIGASSYGLDVKLTLDPTRKIVQKVTEELDILRGIISDPDLDVETRVEAMNSALELMQKKLKGIDPIAMKVAIDGMADAANGLAKSANEAASGIIDDTTKFNLAVAQIQEENSKLRAQIYSQTGYKTPGISSMSEKGGIVFGRKTSPYMPVGFNPIQEELKANQGATDAQFYDKMQKTQALPADGEPITLSQKTPDMDWTSYYQTIEAQLAEHEANKEQLTKQGKEKLQLLQDDYATYLAKSNANVIEADKKAFNLRMQTASDMASMMGQTASMLYEASGKKSKEAFYVMKAMAFAEAAIKGYQAIMTAYASGQAAGAPYAGAAVGAAYAAIASAFVGVQLGLIASQTIQGPGKAEGGPIEGGTGHKDDVPIMAMGGEYIIRRSSTKKYGASFLDALNKGLIPVNELNFSVPNAPAPNYGQTHFAEGGQAMASNINAQKQPDAPAQDIQIVNVIDPGLLDKYLASHAGQRTLVNVLASNKYELQQVMR